MSTVTNVMISDDSIGGDSLSVKVGLVLNMRMIPSDQVGGNKCLENNLYIGAFNNFDLDKFISDMRGIYYGRSIDDDVQLFVKRQEESRWGEVDWQKK